MRNLLPCLALAALAITPLTTRTADACGGSYEAVRPAPPQVTVVSTHMAELTSSRSRSVGRRSFALLGTQPTLSENPGWRKLMSTSYDPIEVAPTNTYYIAHEFTLLGQSGTRVVNTRRRVALKNVLWTLDMVFDAFELPMQAGDDFTIALRGDHADAVWHELRGSYTFTNAIHGTSLSITRKERDVNGASFTVFDGRRAIGSYRGTVLGAVDVDGARHLVVTNGNGMATTLAVPMS